SVLDQAGVEKYRHDAAVARLQVQILAVRIPVLAAFLEDADSPGAFAGGNQIPDGHASHLPARVPDELFGHLVCVEDAAALVVDRKDRRRRVVSGLLVAGLLLAQLVLATFDEQI